MNYLEYRTRGNSKPNNKPNVYFSAHPDDFDIYFGVLSEEILQHSNCAIWYSLFEKDINNQDHMFDLNQMQLFVIPVTSRFLSGDSIALHELRYALHKHIPVLPIAVEQGLEEQFSEVCGNIHLVDRTSQDVTAIGYDEKLSRFLSSVLLDNKTTQRIRNAFDAYIFLSYRKKDREQAQKLMRLIHMNETCQNIAIWYDEFLVPGENFSDAIAEAMQNSDAFALAVTPNLLEDGNYVQQIEYPFAKSLRKQIFPFELQKTDRIMLEAKYAGLAECIDTDEESVIRYMVEAYKTLAIQPKTRDSVHNFFIGLAYLNGIDVEKDFGKAVKLITNAAEDNLPDAMKKLVSMYREAEGLDRDYDKAIEWQVRYVERMKKDAESNPSADSVSQLFQAMADLISFYMEQNRYEDARQLCIELEEMGSDFEDPSCMMYTLYMHPKIEQGTELLGKNTEDPKTLFLKCCKFCKKEYEKNQSQTALQILAQSYLELGRIAYGAAQITIAREFYEKSMYYCRYLTEKYSQPRYRNLLSITLAEHASAECFLKRYNKASKDLNEALYHACALYDEYRTPDLCKSVAALYMQLGELFVATDKIVDARNQYAQAEKLFNHYKQQTMSLDAEVALLDLYDNLAELYSKDGQEDIAWNYYCQEDSLANCVVQHGNHVDVSFVRWRISIGKGGLLNKAGRVEDAMGMYIEAYESAQGVSSENKTLQRYAQYIRYASAAMIYSHAKENKMSAYAKQYRTKLLAMIPKISIPKSGDLKELWSRKAIFGGAAFNPLSTYAELMGDIFNWVFDNDEFMGIKVQPVLKWLKANLFMWRIPFYPLLSMAALLFCHLIYGYMDFDPLSVCYTDCLIGQTIYQSISSLIIAIFYAVIRTRIQSKSKIWINIGASLLITLLVGVSVAVVVGSDTFVPDSIHMAYLILPLFSASVGCIVTKISDIFLRLVVKE